MSTDQDIDRSLVEFAQKIAAIPKGIADEGRPVELSPGAVFPALADKSETGSWSLKDLVPSIINRIGTPELALPFIADRTRS